ncbi:MAG: glycosyltransferase family 8 protein [Lachnospira sp.]
MNIMIVTNSRYLKYAYICMFTLFECHPHDNIDIYLTYEDLTQEELNKFRAFVASFEGKQLHPLYVGEEFKKRVVSRNGIGVETYYRILGIDLLPEELDRILYMDVDMVVRGPLNQLYNMQIEGHPFVVCEDIYGIINGFHDANKKRLAIPGRYSYFNAGVMLYNLEYLRANNAAQTMLDCIYKDYERYEYNDQDVMNELYYDKLIYAGWDEYNCPPAYYYVDKNALSQGKLQFADYNVIKDMAVNPDLLNNYTNLTEQIYENARIIHYLGDTKPWSNTRKAARVYEIFDAAYLEACKRMGFEP